MSMFKSLSSALIIVLLTLISFQSCGTPPADTSLVTVTDTPGITVSTISGNTTEAGGTATFTVLLDSQPTADVTIGVSSSDTTEGTVSPSTLTFTSSNWSTAQTVTVTGVDDTDTDGDQSYTIVLSAASSPDTNYNGIDPTDVDVTNTDDDEANGTISHTTILLSILDGTTVYDSGEDVVIDPQNNIYVAGITKGDLGDGLTNTGGDDAFLRKYDESGTIVWAVLIGTAVEDQANGVTLDLSGNVYMTGETKGDLSGETNLGGSDAFITKHDSSGTPIWTVLLGTASADKGSGIAVDSLGNIIIVGYTDGDMGSGNANLGTSDAFIAKYDSSGTSTWTKILGSTGFDYAYAVATDSSDNIYVTGSTNSDLNGETNSGGLDAFIAKYDSTNTLLWLKLLGTAGDEEGLDITTDSDGNVYISGYTNGDLSETNSWVGGTDAFMAKYTSSGTKEWTVLLGTSTAERATGIQVDSSDKIYLTGRTEGNLGDKTNSGATDTFVAQYSSSATLTSVTLLGTSGYEYSNAITVDLNGNIYIVGRSNGALDGKTNNGNYDFFIVKM